MSVAAICAELDVALAQLAEAEQAKEAAAEALHTAESVYLMALLTASEIRESLEAALAALMPNTSPNRVRVN